jgi:drug/metabolite transporter (DMT)-like permease
MSHSQGLEGDDKQFAKPIMMLLLMFTAMVPAIFFWFIQQMRLPYLDRDVVPMKTFCVLIIPCLCDLMCTLLLMVAQLYITASLWQMMRGTVIIVTALLKKTVLGHRLRMHMWCGVGVITLAMLVVASSTLIKVDAAVAAQNGTHQGFGIMLVLIGCLAQGVQYVFEEKVMNVDNAPPLVIYVFSMFAVYI